MATATSLDTVLGQRPDLMVRYRALDHLLRDGRIDPVLLDLCQRRVGTLLGCPRHQGPLPRSMSDLESAAVDMAEQFVLDPHGLTDEQAAAVSSRLGPSGMVAFTTALALFEGFCRFERMLGEA